MKTIVPRWVVAKDYYQYILVSFVCVQGRIYVVNEYPTSARNMSIVNPKLKILGHILSRRQICLFWFDDKSKNILGQNIKNFSIFRLTSNNPICPCIASDESVCAGYHFILSRNKNSHSLWSTIIGIYDIWCCNWNLRLDRILTPVLTLLNFVTFVDNTRQQNVSLLFSFVRVHLA